MKTYLEFLVEKYTDKIDEECLNYLSNNQNLTEKLIQFHLESWNWNIIKNNSYLAIYILKNRNKNLCWKFITRHLNITQESINDIDFKVIVNDCKVSLSNWPPPKNIYTYEYVYNDFKNITSYDPIVIESDNDLFWKKVSSQLNLTPYFIEKYKHKLIWKDVIQNSLSLAHKLYYDSQIDRIHWLLTVKGLKMKKNILLFEIVKHIAMYL